MNLIARKNYPVFINNNHANLLPHPSVNDDINMYLDKVIIASINGEMFFIWKKSAREGI